MTERALALATDLYELTMAAAYFDNRIQTRAIFELFVRRLPDRRSYLISAGLEQTIDYLTRLRFTGDEVAFLRAHPAFADVSPAFFEYLADFRFTGDVWAMPEGTIAFGNEPLVRVAAPIIEAQVIETFLIATIASQTMIASKAARVVTAAAGREVIEFGTRRAHGSEAGLFAARAAFIGGAIGTSNVEAGYLFGIPTYGTLAHSFVMSFDDEDDAFTAFLKVFPKNATVLVDTYDTLAAIERLARDYGSQVAAVRLDSGDIRELSVRAREILDRAGMQKTKVFASSDLNEYRIAELLGGGARIDAFGVGTELATSFDAPALSAVYKLVGLEEDGRIVGRIKLSKDKATYPGPKQVWRETVGGRYRRDLIAAADEAPPGPDWQPLLEAVVSGGRCADERFADSDGDDNVPMAARRAARKRRLDAARARAARELGRLPDGLLALEAQAAYPVSVSARLQHEQDELRAAHAQPSPVDSPSVSG
ncbi:MAG TPA: nicotinate phosphoribosyltransferase [Blastocatellia bacterium]|nr:nicotinate phosphoribosyltransferase [Blastocatellia bacterium]